MLLVFSYFPEHFRFWDTRFYHLSDELNIACFLIQKTLVHIQYRHENESLGKILKMRKNEQKCLKKTWKSAEWGTKKTLNSGLYLKILMPDSRLKCCDHVSMFWQEFSLFLCTHKMYHRPLDSWCFHNSFVEGSRQHEWNVDDPRQILQVFRVLWWCPTTTKDQYESLLLQTDDTSEGMAFLLYLIIQARKESFELHSLYHSDTPKEI